MFQQSRNQSRKLLDSLRSPPLSSPAMTQQKREPSAAGQIILDHLGKTYDTQAAFARRIGLSEKFMWQMIHGIRRIPLGRIAHIADGLGLEGEDRANFVLCAGEHPGHRRSERRDHSDDSNGVEAFEASAS